MIIEICILHLTFQYWLKFILRLEKYINISISISILIKVNFCLGIHLRPFTNLRILFHTVRNSPKLYMVKTDIEKSRWPLYWTYEQQCGISSSIVMFTLSLFTQWTVCLRMCPCQGNLALIAGWYWPGGFSYSNIIKMKSRELAVSNHPYYLTSLTTDYIFLD